MSGITRERIAGNDDAVDFVHFDPRDEIIVDAISTHDDVLGARADGQAVNAIVEVVVLDYDIVSRSLGNPTVVNRNRRTAGARTILSPGWIGLGRFARAKAVHFVARDVNRALRALNVHSVFADPLLRHKFVILDKDIRDSPRVLADLNAVRANIFEGVVADRNVGCSTTSGAGNVDGVHAISGDVSADILKGVAFDEYILGILDDDGGHAGIAKGAVANDFLNIRILIASRSEQKRSFGIAVKDLAVAKYLHFPVRIERDVRRCRARRDGRCGRHSWC